MEDGFSIVFVIIWLAFFFGSIAKVKKKKSAGNTKPKYTPQKQAVPIKNSVGSSKPKTFSGPAKGVEVVKLKDSVNNVFLEDRKNDWLARQIREERRVLSRADMLDLGAAHDKACQADLLKRIHIAEHDDSIDNAEVE